MNENIDSLTRIALAVEHPVAVLAAIEVVRREGDEAALGQPGREVVIGRQVALDHVLGQAVAAVLADHDRPPLARLEILRHAAARPRRRRRGTRRAPPRSRSTSAGRRSCASADAAGKTGSSMTADHLPGQDLAQRPDFSGKDLRGLLLDAEHAEPFAARGQGADQGGLIEKEGVARRVGSAEQALDVTLQLRDLALLAGVRIEGRPPVGRRPLRTFSQRGDSEEPGEGLHGLGANDVADHVAVAIGRGRAAGSPGAGARRFAATRRGRRRGSESRVHPPRPRRAAPSAMAGGPVNARGLAVLDHEPARGDQRGDLRIAELVQQAPDVAINAAPPRRAAANGSSRSPAPRRCADQRPRRRRRSSPPSP